MKRLRVWFWNWAWGAAQRAHDWTGVLRDRAYDAHNRASNLLHYGKQRL